jgi:phospholipid/cholesterol/gamma-HCH transport system permease protein
MGFLHHTGRLVTDYCFGAGYAILLALRASLHVGAAARKAPEIVGHMYAYGIRTFPVTAVMGIFFGAILALQTGIELDKFGQVEAIGMVVSAAMCREMGPFITALVLTATVGSNMAAEIGTMRVSEELDALEVMAIDPVRFLVMPRLLALVLVCPILTILVDFLGVSGGMMVAVAQLGVAGEVYREQALEVLRYSRTIFDLPKDVYTGLAKACVFGLTIGTIGLSAGMRAEGGALGVGRAVRGAVINCLLLIIILSYYLTWIFYR